MTGAAAILTCPAPEAVAGYARKLITQAGKARRRIGADDDPQALHDFRVAIRRLRSHLRAYRDCHAVGRKIERRLRDLAGATGGGRNAEVALEWLETARTALPDATACDALAAELAGERDAAYARVATDLGERWDALVAGLRQRLGRRSAHPADPASPPFAGVAEGRLRDHEAKLKALLSKVRTLADQDPAHRARIEAKRLRYLIEPLRGAVPGAAGAVKALAAFQDTVGIMHDRQVMIGHLQSALHHAAAAHADDRLARAVSGRDDDAADPVQAGLLALAATAARERAEHFAALKAGYLADGGARLLAPIDGLCTALAEVPGG